MAPEVIGIPAFLAAQARRFSLLVITFPLIPGEIRTMPSSLRIRMPSPRQMIVSPISKSRVSSTGPWQLLTIENGNLRA